MTEIAAASKEQSQGIGQINTAVAEMDKVVQKNASDSEETASLSEQLSSQAEALQGSVKELEELVKGLNTNGYRPSRSQIGKKEQGPRNNSGSVSTAAENKLNHQSRPGYQSRSEQIIPLDDDSFKDYY